MVGPCGHEIPSGQPFCPVCGQSAAGETSAYGEAPPRRSIQMSTNRRARNALIMGVVSLVCCGIVLGPLAIHDGMVARREIANSQFEGGDGLALAGIICGAAGLVLFFVNVALYVSIPR